MSETNHRNKPLLIAVVLAVLAAGNGIYLTLVHLDYETGTLGLATVCHAFAEAGCSVTAGRFGTLGPFSVATIGFAGAMSMLVLAICAYARRRQALNPYRSTLLLFAFVAAAASALMGVLSAVEGSFCPFCVAWYALNVGLLVAAWSARNRGLRTADIVDHATGPSGLVAITVFVLALIAGLLLSGQRRQALIAQHQADQAQQLAEHGDEIAAKIVADLTKKPPASIDLADAPSKGPLDAEVTLVEFADFECPYCGNQWNEVNQYLKTTKRRVRVLFAHFPLDSSCNRHVDRRHPHACLAAIASLCADKQEQFWAYGQMLFDNQRDLKRDDLTTYAERVGLDMAAFTTCLDDPESRARISANADLGQTLKIAGTPTLYINGYGQRGGLPAPLLDLVVEQLLTAPAPAPDRQTP